jgi:anti-sigma regulatory factor (Ser/Thr protein kinase)
MLDDERFDGVAFVLDITERKRAENALLEVDAFNRDFYRRTILLATGGKLEIVEPKDLEAPRGKPAGRWAVASCEEYSASIRHARDVGQSLGLAGQKLHDFMSCVGEMMSNAMKHAGSGEAACYETDSSVIFVVADKGPGIPAINLPDIAFVHGFSTKGTGGLGFKLIIDCADKVYLATGPHGTTLAVEINL